MPEQIIVDHDLFVTVAISITGILFTSLGTLSFLLGKMLLGKLDRKIDTCHASLQEKIDFLVKSHDDIHKLTHQAHDRIIEHIEKHHTK